MCIKALFWVAPLFSMNRSLLIVLWSLLCQILQLLLKVVYLFMSFYCAGRGGGGFGGMWCCIVVFVCVPYLLIYCSMMVFLSGMALVDQKPSCLFCISIQSLLQAPSWVSHESASQDLSPLTLRKKQQAQAQTVRDLGGTLPWNYYSEHAWP